MHVRGDLADLDPFAAAPQSPTHCAYTRKTLGWEPTHLSLLQDLENIQA
jgi:hypothetical protein